MAQAFLCGVFLDTLFGVWIVNEAVDEDSGGVDLVGVELAGGDDVLGFGDGGSALMAASG